MPTLSCSTTNWKATSSAACQQRNERIAKYKVTLRPEARVVGKLCRYPLGGAGATGMHSLIHQILGHRGLWANRLLPDASDRVPGHGFRTQPHRESRNGPLFGTTRKSRCS